MMGWPGPNSSKQVLKWRRRQTLSLVVIAAIVGACGSGGFDTALTDRAEVLRSTTTTKPTTTTTSTTTTTTTIDPIVKANAAGFVALCNDGGFSTNTDFRATCSGGDGIKRWLATYGECSNGRVIVMGASASCGGNGGFKGLLPADFRPEAGDDDVALCNDGNFSNNIDFRATCSGGDGIDRWLATYGECSNGSTITMSRDAACPAGTTFVGLRADDFEPQSAALPDFVGQRLDIAITGAEALSLGVTWKDADENRSIFDRANWFVVRQSITPGTSVLPGRSLVLFVTKNDPSDTTSGGLPLTPANVEAALAGAFGVSTIAEVCTESTKFCFITGIETDPDEIIVTLQIAERDKEFGEDIARTMWGLIGVQFPALEYIRTINALGQNLADVSCSEAIGERNCS